MGWLKAKLIITSIRFVDSSIWTLIDEMNIQAYINAFVGVKIISRQTKFIALPETKGAKMAGPPPLQEKASFRTLCFWYNYTK